MCKILIWEIVGKTKKTFQRKTFIYYSFHGLRVSDSTLHFKNNSVICPSGMNKPYQTAVFKLKLYYSVSLLKFNLHIKAR